MAKTTVVLELTTKEAEFLAAALGCCVAWEWHPESPAGFIAENIYDALDGVVRSGFNSQFEFKYDAEEKMFVVKVK
jgi:hypothetical protein